MELLNLEESMEELRESFRSRRTRNAAWRRAQLKGLLRMLEEKEEEIFKTLKEDIGKHSAEAFRDEIGTLTKSLNLALSCLEDWMASKKVHVPVIAFPTSGEIVPEPLGVVLIFSTWNFPIGLALEPLIGAIAAGNVAVVKPSELAPACSSFLAKHVPMYLDNKAVKIMEGGVSTAERLLEEKWDKIFFTGSAQVAHVVMSAAAKHLTPVTLELGGKCPAIFDSFSSLRDREVAIRRLVNGKWGLCSGQACVGIDYLLVEEKHASKVIDLLKNRIKNFYGDSPQETNSISRIINKNHFMRLKNLIEDSTVKASIVHGGAMDEDNLFIEPTILLDPPLKSQIMTTEIFGPFLPVITLKKIEDSIEFISSRPQPLAIYAFTKDETFKKRIISETSSGSVTFNDAIIQFACDTLPFGGVGQSGFGKYHGKFSFDEFSHGKAVLRRSLITELSFQYPPWSDYKIGFLRAAYNFDYIALFLLLIGLKRK
ncbi:aldehyde dehydrogenase family 3 member F1-like [Magnolia sinica]|uniref:aldehyde dehydrogenase family 3 member F1-like n=1 Tax=Magnolia sinica TaxID=86752 RepID=UPI0026584FAE|nr:aldehyde dehydrogenase family 3 member F1-like [Magnolia sinica]